MARMFPSELPSAVRQDPARAAEVFVYDRLAALPDPWHAFYSVRWQACSRRGVLRDGEADFVLAHPVDGLLVLEVKGGQVKCRAGRWASCGPDGRPRRGSRDPVEQACESHHVLREIATAQRGWNQQRPFLSGHLVAFPDVAVPAEQVLPPDLPRPILLDAPAFDRLPEVIEAAVRHYAQGRPAGELGEDRLQILIDLLDAWIILPASSSRVAIDQRVSELTAQQMMVLDVLRHHHRARVVGCAGAGKTVLAMEKARRLAATGQRVLLTCFNRPLGQWLGANAPAGVTATNFHELCTDLAREAGVDHSAPEPLTQDYFDTVLPAALRQAAAVLGRRFDALLVDEAQDLKEGSWRALADLLADPARGTVYLFYDPGQDLFTPGPDPLGAGWEVLVDDQPFALTQNCRSTRQIHRVADTFGQEPATCEGPQGPPVTVVEYGGRRELVEAVTSLLHHLTADEGYAPDDLVLLTGHKLAAHSSPFAPGTVLGDWRLTAEAPGPGEIQVSTVQRFKGLERRAVIVADLDETCVPNLESVLYVGCSRAQERLAVVIAASAPATVRERLAAAAARVDA